MAAKTKDDEEEPDFELKTKNGHRLDATVSSLQKSIRRGLEERALYFMQELIESGYTAYFWRRIFTICIEDVAASDPHSVILINALAQMNEKLNHKKEIRDTYCPGMAVLYLCRATKSREIDYALDWIELMRKEGMRLDPDDIELDCHTHEGRQRLRQLAKKSGRTYEELVDDKFYYEGILENNPVSVKGDYWKKKVWEKRKLDKSKLNLKYETDKSK
jgi:replication-associated recombination protein RarA